MGEVSDIERAVEALLFAAGEPLSNTEISARVGPLDAIDAAIESLCARYAGRGVNLVCVAGRWRFQTAADLAGLMVQEREEPMRLSRAALETLAIIAYQQPVTRAEIEAVRGVQASRGTLDALLELGLVRMRGRRRSPGRPVTFGTTDLFLERYGLASIGDLPGAADLRAMGLLSGELPPGFDIPLGGVGEAEDPLEPDDGAPEFHQDFLGPETEGEGESGA